LDSGTTPPAAGAFLLPWSESSLLDHNFFLLKRKFLLGHDSPEMEITKNKNPQAML
jgi:hypothetical protein